MNTFTLSSRLIKYIVTVAVTITVIAVSVILLVPSMPWRVEGKINPAATVSLPNYYMEGMVFQRNKPISLAGKTTPDTRLTVTMSDGVHAVSTRFVSNDKGSFIAEFDAPAAQLAPYTFTITSGDAELLIIHRVYVGDVFLAAGQSNMALNYYDYYGSNSESKDLYAAQTSDLPDLVDDANIHFLVTDSTNSLDRNSSNDLPLRDYHHGSWLAADANHAKYLGYLPQFFAEELRKEDPAIPIGIIQTAWGGTDIVRHMKGGDIYKTHIRPLRHYSFAGILWYQGENDAAFDATAYSYSYHFPQLIDEYRALLGEADLPFLFVQLARYDGNANTSIIRQAQLHALEAATVSKNLALCVSIDTDKGNYRTIHPLGKEIIAYRMARQWQAMEQHQTVPEGPIIDHAVARDNGSTVILHFKKNTAEGLQSMAPIFSRSATAKTVAIPVHLPLVGFEAAGPDGKFHQASAAINTDGTIRISATDVDDIRQVRYLWEAAPSASVLLYNSQQLPASPFTIKVDDE